MRRSVCEVLVFMAVVCSFLYLLLLKCDLLATVRPILQFPFSCSSCDAPTVPLPQTPLIPEVGTAIFTDRVALTGTAADGPGMASSDGDTMHAGSSSAPLLTLFSTWAEDKDLARNLTMLNWAKLRPAVLPVLFTNSSVQVARAHSYGWHTMPITRTAVGIPVLKYMYLDAIRRFNTTLVAFANGDILFTESLLDSLHAILADQSLPLTRKHLLVIGQRTNVDNMTEEEALTFEDIVSVARKRGELFTPDGVDYFITDRNYPWKRIPELVIGRLNYDSYIVLNAIQRGHVVVDGTQTALAVHQTTEAGNFESEAHTNVKYNREMLLRMYPGIHFKSGRVDCALWETRRDTEGQVIVHRRPPNPQYCW